jgi:DNA-binding transcriptional regulator YhcF (GntR family)
MAPAPSIDQVYAALMGRLQRGVYPMGSKLPSCRRLAEDLQSNPSTVDRALRRMAEQGLVRTISRQGSFVAATKLLREVSASELASEFESLIHRARRSGISATEIRAMWEAGLKRVTRSPRVALVECNQRDLDVLGSRIEAISGLRITGLLMDDDNPPSGLDSDFDVIVTPFFHLNEVTQLVADPDTLVAVNVTASPQVLRRIAMIDPHQTVAVAAPTDRGLQQVGGLVRQIFGGPVVDFLIGRDQPATLATVGAVVMSNASDDLPVLPPDCAVIAVEWMIEDGFGAFLVAQVERLLDRATPAHEPAGEMG